jgi:hypothetical protein
MDGEILILVVVRRDIIGVDRELILGAMLFAG